MEHTAFVAGWKVGGSAQQLYVKESFMKQVCCNHLVNGRKDLFVPQADKTSTFHHIPQPVSQWGEITQWDYFQKRSSNFVRQEMGCANNKAAQRLYWRLAEYFMRVNDGVSKFSDALYVNKLKKDQLRKIFKEYILSLDGI